MANADKFLELLNFMTVLILSVAFHEGAHAWLADRFGDDTPRAHGRMTFNPFAHLHPILTVALPAAFWWMSNGNGWLFMASTPVRPWQMRKPRLDGMLTALGGPAASLLLGIACFVALIAWVAMQGSGKGRVVGILELAVALNFFGAAFNLLPIPPMDGSAILEFFLPRRFLPAWNLVRTYSWVLFAALMFTDVLSQILLPVRIAAEDIGVLGTELGVFLGGRIRHG